MQLFSFRTLFAVVAIASLTACAGTEGSSGSGGGGGGGGGGTPPDPVDPPDEVVDANYEDLSDRTAVGTAGMIYVILDGQTSLSSDAVTINYSDGAITGGLLNGRNIDGVTFLNPAGGEFSRLVSIEGESLLGVVGLDVLAGDLPTMGTTDYNLGGVELTAIFENNVYVLSGNAEFTANWGANDNLEGRFFNLTGTDAQGGASTNEGTIILTNANITGDTFAGGSVTGTGLFSDLGGSSSTAGTQGAFFGPDADELGGVLSINDAAQDIRVLGAFQAD